jgi:RNA polymerase sigma-70 factor, ECF subfamily
MMQERTDAELVAAACQGDASCFGELYRRHYQAMVGIAYAALSDRHLAEDAAQEAFAFSCRDLDRLQSPAKFASWVGSICRRVARHLAKTRLRYSLPPDYPTPVDLESNNLPSAADPSDADAEDAQAGLVRHAVQRLSRTGREVIVLHYFGGLSYEQIATVLDISMQAVHGRLLRARRKLADFLGPNWSDGEDS